MPFAEPLENLIADEIENTIRGINEADGYSITFAHESVGRFSTGPFKRGLPAAAIYLLSDGKQPEENIGLEELKMRVIIEAWKNESYEGEMDKELKRMKNDIYRAMMLDRTRGGHALETRYYGAVYFLEDEGASEGGCALDFDVHYRYVIGDPSGSIG